MTAPSVRRARPGGRSARVKSAVLAATLSALLADGYAALSMADVAHRAGVHETSIYRRWGTKAALALEACLSSAASAIAVPDTGALRSDLRALVAQVIRFLRSDVGRALLGVALQTFDQTGDVARLRTEFWSRRLGAASVIFERARRRGELSAGVDAGALLELVVSPLYFRAAISGEPLSPRRAYRQIDMALGRLRASPERGT